MRRLEAQQLASAFQAAGHDAGAHEAHEDYRVHADEWVVDVQLANGRRVVVSGMEFYCYGPDGEKEFTTFMA